jgi:vanillin dehydrogenase
MKELSLLIGGRYSAASNGRSFERINPVTGEPASRAAAATLEDADAAVAAARAAFPTWSSLAPTKRRARLLEAANLLESRTAEFIDIGVIDHVTPGMDVYSQESFGNLVSIVRVDDDEEALRIANDTEYGLSAAVFSGNITRAMSIAQRIESGICHINGATVHDEAQMPFGGVKASGYGRFGGKAAIAEFTDLRWITIQTGNRHYPI